MGGKRAVLDLNVGIIINLPSDVKMLSVLFYFSSDSSRSVCLSACH